MLGVWCNGLGCKVLGTQSMWGGMEEKLQANDALTGGQTKPCFNMALELCKLVPCNLALGWWLVARHVLRSAC